MKRNKPDINSEWIVNQRQERHQVDPKRPYDYLVEKERTADGEILDTGIIFLSNKECSFRCLMCDLWKNTLTESVAIGDIPEQIVWAIDKMPKFKQIKLYNSGSFFDQKSIPYEDYPAIASLVNSYDRVIVEAHPKIIGPKCLEFNDLLHGALEVAIGLETVHPIVLEKLNKKMDLKDFVNAVQFLSKHGIKTRAFILVKPPFMNELEGVFWAKKSIDQAFDAGVDSCTVIPVRSGNGAMEQLAKNGDFERPELKSLEEVLDYGVSLKRGRVFADTWDLEQFSNCDLCLEERIRRIEQINLYQNSVPPIKCTCLIGVN